MNKISYALGLGIAHQLKSMGIEDFSVEDFSQSVSDVLADKTPAMTNREAQELLNDYFQKKQKEVVCSMRCSLPVRASAVPRPPTQWCATMREGLCRARCSTAPMSATSLPSSD